MSRGETGFIIYVVVTETAREMETITSDIVVPRKGSVPRGETGFTCNRAIASSKQVREPQHNMLIITNVNQDIETTLKQDESEGAMAPLSPIIAMPVLAIGS